MPVGILADILSLDINIFNNYVFNVYFVFCYQGY